MIKFLFDNEQKRFWFFMLLALPLIVTVHSYFQYGAVEIAGVVFLSLPFVFFLAYWIIYYTWKTW